MIIFLQKVILKIDEKFNLKFYEIGKKLYHQLDDFCNIFFRLIDKIRIWLKVNFNEAPIRLHLGCGERSIKGSINIDFRKTSATDYVCDIEKLPFKYKTIELIESYHVIEHLPHRRVPDILKKWYDLLKPGGKLVLELPDFDVAVKEYLNGNDARIYNIFGYQRFPGDTHLFGYNYKRIKVILNSIGYLNIRSAEPQDYHVSEEPCLRIEAFK